MADSKLSVGNVEILDITDIVVDFPMPLSQVFPDVPLEGWTPYRDRFPDCFPRPDTWRVHFGGFLIRSEGRIILVDTGIGSSATNPGTVGMFTGGTDGQLPQAIQESGVGLGEIDTVFFTHLHPDHVGWNLKQGAGDSKQATFPNARYLVPEADWSAFQTPEGQAHFPFSFWEETLAPLASQGVLEQLSGQQALTSEIMAIPTPGHTPGSMSLAISSAGERALIIGDVTTNPAQVTEPDWVFAFDMDSAVARQSRIQMIDRAESENAYLIACHFHNYGRVVRIDGRRYWQGL